MNSASLKTIMDLYIKFVQLFKNIENDISKYPRIENCLNKL